MTANGFIGAMFYVLHLLRITSYFLISLGTNVKKNNNDLIRCHRLACAAKSRLKTGKLQKGFVKQGPERNARQLSSVSYSPVRQHLLVGVEQRDGGLSQCGVPSALEECRRAVNR